MVVSDSLVQLPGAPFFEISYEASGRAGSDAQDQLMDKHLSASVTWLFADPVFCQSPGPVGHPGLLRARAAGLDQIKTLSELRMRICSTLKIFIIFIVYNSVLAFCTGRHQEFTDHLCNALALSKGSWMFLAVTSTAIAVEPAYTCNSRSVLFYSKSVPY